MHIKRLNIKTILDIKLYVLWTLCTLPDEKLPRGGFILPENRKFDFDVRFSGRMKPPLGGISSGSVRILIHHPSGVENPVYSLGWCLHIKQ